MTMMPNVIQFQPRPIGLDRAMPRLRRPRLLVRAAKAGLAAYSRKRDLRRALKCEELPVIGAALSRLIAEEERLDQARRDGAADYDVQHHLLLLIALIAEALQGAARPVSTAETFTFPETATRGRL